MNKFNYLDYKQLIVDLIKEAPNGGRGLHSQLARAMDVHPTLLTHVLRGESHLGPEQALKVCNFFSFSELETDFFVQLLNWNRAGDSRTRDFFEKKLDALRSQGLSLKAQLRKQSSLSVEEQSIFYSDWAYSAVRLATALPGGSSVENISKMLNLPILRVSKIVDFLLKTGLCKIENGRLSYGVFSTYIGSESPLVRKHHENWRLRSASHGSLFDEDLMSTTVVTLTKVDFLKLRELFIEALKKFDTVTDESDPKHLAYLAIDWIRIT